MPLPLGRLVTKGGKTFQTCPFPGHCGEYNYFAHETAAPIKPPRGTLMFCNKAIATGVALIVLGAVTLLGQSTVGAHSILAGLELPVTMRQNVEAGRTPAGSKVQAKLEVATLVNGVVIPRGAILFGEVIESLAQSGTDPSRLGIRMEAARWKKGSAPVAVRFVPEVYLTAWYYPAERATNESVNDASQGPPEDPRTGRRRLSRGGGVYTNPPPEPSMGRDSNQDRSGESSSSDSDVTKHRVPMKNVESTHENDGAVTLTCKRSNIKLDKSTTYVLAAGDLRPPK
jgi:hypothetical protein